MEKQCGASMDPGKETTNRRDRHVKLTCKLSYPWEIARRQGSCVRRLHTHYIQAPRAYESRYCMSINIVGGIYHFRSAFLLCSSCRSQLAFRHISLQENNTGIQMRNSHQKYSHKLSCFEAIHIPLRIKMGSLLSWMGWIDWITCTFS